VLDKERLGNEMSFDRAGVKNGTNTILYLSYKIQRETTVKRK